MQTKKWIVDVVIGCNFCPFAAREIKRDTIYYEVTSTKTLDESIKLFLNECRRLDIDNTIETSFLIFSDSFQNFDEYLYLVAQAEKVIKQKGYEGIYQVASFHPLYCFAGSPANDAANYTNRSPYPMLHLLREEKIEQALEKYPDPERIPDRNIRFAREKGEAYMKMLRDACL
ncbi:MAG TPA: DUF1415 domain-containing protein [Chitinophagaceae bacterium]